MSLQVHLPLNKEGIFYNQGLADVTFTRSSGTYNSNGKLGGCYEFSGQTGNGISASDNGFMSKYINNHSWSICVWVKSTSANTPIMCLSYGLRLFSGSNAYVNLYNSTRSVYCHSGKATNDGNWHHIVATYDVTTNKIIIYVDGSYSNSVNYTSGYTYSSSWTNGLFIGRDPNNNTIDYFYQGALSDVRIYDHCLSPYEVHEIAKGLVLHYPMNDQYVESIVYDCSGYCNNGTVTGSLQVVDDSPRYKQSTKITTSNTIKTTVPILNNIYSFSWWYNKANFAAGDMMWGYADGNRINPLYGLCFNIGDGFSSPWYVPGTTTKIKAPSGNTWHHFVITGDGSASKLYIDGLYYGKCINFKSITGSILHINGWSSGGDYRTNGKISDFRIYSTALSEDDIKELYNTSAIINNNNTLEAYEFVE